MLMRLLALLALLLAAAPAAAAGEECLACHAAQHVKPEAFAASVHAPLGCTGCHANVELKKHPPAPPKTTFEVCKTCHESVFEAYLGSTHGKARANGAPACSGCHKPHEVTRPSLGVPKETCDTCHSGVADSHQKWLPNTARHFETVACAACHSPKAQKKVDLRIFDAAGRELQAGKSTPPDGVLDEKRLWQFVRNASRDAKVTLVGRLEVPDAAQKHALEPAANAIKDCTTCHRKGAQAFQNVTLSLIGADGRRARYEAQKEVLHAPTSVDSVRDFYAVGGTRIQLLDALLALVLVGGITAPLSHLLLRRFLRKKDKDHA